MPNLRSIAIKEIIIKLAKESKPDSVFLSVLQRKACKKYKISILAKPQLLKFYHKLLKEKKIKQSQKLEMLLRRRAIRTLSGVAVITVLTKPFKCPGKCFYCPNERGMPKSYLKNEPAANRAYLTKFDPYKQVKVRLEALGANGHPTDKIELIVLGGTWSVYPDRYKYWFINQCLAACNQRSKTKAAKVLSTWQKERTKLKKEQVKNEQAKNRIVGLTLETRPDCINLEEITKMRDLGCTRVELGVQSIYDNVLRKNLRGHNVATTILATRLLKDAGFKINYHVMLNLPGSNLDKDRKMFTKLFNSSDFKPDLLKIYPCSVLKTAPLYRTWKKGKYKPYTDKELFGLILAIKKKIPAYVRIQRIIRDIPSQDIIAGSKISNLRQLIDQSGKKKCQCIRCREIKGGYIAKTKLKLFRYDYLASKGKEIFLSFEDLKRKNIYALLRLRIPSQEKNLPLLEKSALIRELHTYGYLVPLDGDKKNAQHIGFGKKLMFKAEKIVKKEYKECEKIAVISGVGVRGYYHKLGYRLKDEYMVKETS